MWEWSRGVMVRGRVVEIGGLIDREFQTLRSTVELGSRINYDDNGSIT